MNGRSGATGERRRTLSCRRSIAFALKLAVVVPVMAASYGIAPPAYAADCNPGNPYPPSQCTISVSSTVVAAGGSLTISGSGFAGRSTVSIDLLSRRLHLKTVHADSDGTALASVKLPDDVEEGTHTLMMTGKNTDGTTRVLEVTIRVYDNHGSTGKQGPGNRADLAATGASDMTPIEILSSGALLASGAATLLLIRSRRRRAHAD